MSRLLIVIAAVLAMPLAAQESLFIQVPSPIGASDKTRVEAKALFSMPSPGGFLPVRITVTNQRKNDAELKFRSDSRNGAGDEDSRVESEFTVDSKAGSTVVRDLLVPLSTAFESRYGYRNDSLGFRMSGPFGAASGSLGSGFGDGAPAVLMSEKLHTPNASALDAALNARLSGSSGSASFAARFEPLEMPEDWRAYSGYDALLLTAEDWGKVPAGARNAILQWVRLGGTLEVHAVTAATPATLGISLDGEISIPGNFGFGNVSILSFPASFTLDPVSTVDRLMPPAPSNLNQSIREDYSGTWPLHDRFGSQAFNYAIFIVVLIAFGILVGPVNLFVFAKSGKRHKLFITTPIISLATSALLIVLILLKDGTGGRGARVALIEVRPDSGENAAYVLQEQVSRTGVLFGSGFEITESSAISPVPLADSPWARLTSRNGGGGMRYDMVLEDNVLKSSGDWFQSRSEQGQLLRSVIPTRGRIELRGEAGAPALLSTFEHPLARLYYVDRSGGFWLARDVVPGKTVTATPINEVDYDGAVREESLLLGRRHGHFFKLASARPDHFIAITDEAPGVATFGAIRWQDTHTILTGPVLR